MNTARLIAVILAIGVGASLWRPAQPLPRTEEGDGSLMGPDARVSGPARTLKFGEAFPPDRSWPRGARWSPPSRNAFARLPDPNPPYHGVAIQVYSVRDVLPTYGRMIREIAELGADTVMFSVNGYQRHVESSRIATDPDETPTDDEWLRLFALARQRGLRVVLMPKILLSDPRAKDWRGKIRPTSWDEWFHQYQQFVLHFAELAERGQVEVFIVGSELISTEKFTDRWRNTIAAVREVYHGRLSYSANWDHYRGIQFWDDLDLIGMTTYHALADEPAPSLAALRASWGPIKTHILDWQREIGRPILFTEAGWCSQEGCSVEAWNYYRQEAATEAGRNEQRDCYQAFVDSWADVPEVGGILWWEWTAGQGGDADVGYTPKNKPAEAVLRNLFREAAARPRVADPSGTQGPHRAG
jgi:hypothetical protein